ncbi:hypothetical protein BC629DRAFT_941422 [Irpex lacteus]|nr:hypothetical protein BC629DRAFT_941422 [Irpex lacteus]
MTGGRPEAFRRRDRIFVTLHICGLPSSVVARGQRPQVMRRILSTALPRPLTAVSRLWNSLTLDDMEIDGAANLIGLLQCIQFDKSTNTLQQLSFRNVKLNNPAEIDDLFVFFMQWPEFIGLSCTGCVDAISLFLLRICDAILRGSSSTEPYSPFLFARRATRSWPLPDSGHFFLEHSLEVYTRTVDTYPFSPIFFFYTTPFDRDESREQYVISSPVIEISVLDESVASVYDTVIPTYDWEEIGAALHDLKPSVVITLNCHSYSQFIQFCEAQQRLNILKTLDSRFTLEVRHVDSREQPMDESRLKQVEDLWSLLDSMGEHVSVQPNTK